MVVSITADYEVFSAAIAAAEEIGKPGELRGLNAPIDGSMIGRLEEAWDEIKEMLQRAYDIGAEKAAPLVDNIQERIDELLSGAGTKARELRMLLLARLREYQVTFVDGALQQIRAEVKVGGATMRLSQLQLVQKVVLSGSLKASLTEAFVLTSNGELEVVASYTALT